MANQKPIHSTGSEVEAICRRFIELRYELSPYLYCLFVEAHRTGAPVTRPLFWHYQNDPVAVAIGDQFLLGPDLLVAPVLQQGAIARSVYLPHETWFDFWTGERHQGGRHIAAAAPLERMPLFVRAGAILPMTPIRQYMGETVPDRIQLHLWLGGRGMLNWYEDDGVSLDYETGGFHERQIRFAPTRTGLQLKFSPSRGNFPSQVKNWQVVLHAVQRSGVVTLDGKRVPHQFQRKGRLLKFSIPSSTSAQRALLDSVTNGADPR